MNEFEFVDIEALSETPIIILANLLSKIYEEQLSRITDDRFLNQRASRFVLEVLEKQDGQTQNDLVRITHMKGSTVSVTLAKLEEKEIVKRIPDSYDMRCIRVYLTQKGKELCEKRKDILKQFDKIGNKSLTPKEIKDTIFVLETYLNNLLEQSKN